jgi:predicted PurR-regulated permease PerM
MVEHTPSSPERGALRFRQAFLLVLVVGITLLFLAVIRQFLLAVVLAAVFAGMMYPLYDWIRLRLGGRKALAASATLLILIGGVGLPLAGFLTLVASEAVQLSRGADTWFQAQGPRLGELRSQLERIPFVDEVLPEGEQLVVQFRELAERAGPMLMGTVAAATRGTLAFFLQLFILLYAFFFFLIDGPAILRKILYYTPLAAEEEEQLLERFVSVTRATLKGSLLIGVIQGAAAGVAFWVAGVPGPAFWGTVMVVLSVIPALGAALVWIPAVIYLFLVGQIGAAVGLLLWCAVVVSTVDNFLRPRLIGRDARMSDLLILLSTLGGIVLFGAVGFIVGPIVAALFVTIWHIYGETFSAWLPPVPERVGDVEIAGERLSLKPGGETEGAEEPDADDQKR